jgi:tRNA(fMet)-specific endonuclease VapC
MDSGIANDYINRRHGVWERARLAIAAGDVVGIGTPVLGELTSGLERSASRDRNLQRLKVALNSWRLWPYESRAAFEFGRIHAQLVRSGRPMQTIDIMVAAIASSLGDCTVVTTDSDFGAIVGLRVENWATP